MKVSKEDWIWLPHAAHFILGDKCSFHLATKIGDYIVSTVGEYLLDSSLREAIAKIRGINLDGSGDARELDWLQKNGYEQLGMNRIYETMVFRATPDEKNTCCPWRIIVEDGELDMAGYNEAGPAYLGHLSMCEKWSDSDSIKERRK